MSKASWAGVNPATGSGDVSVTVSAESENTGRNNRTTNLTITSNAGTATVAVTQAGKSAFVEFDGSVSSKSVSKNATELVISGTSNAKTLTINIPVAVTMAYFKSFTVAGSSVALDAGYHSATWDSSVVHADPGATASYAWTATIVIEANETEDSRSCPFELSGTDAETKYLTIIQAAGDPTLEVDTTAITLDAASGSTATLNITSNTSWTIS